MCHPKVNIAMMISLFLMQEALALPEDAHLPLQVQAGSADLNQETRSGLFTGGVALDQGTTHIRADKAMTQGDHEHQLKQAIIEGSGQNLAHYWTVIDKNKPPLHAYAMKIWYYPLQQSIVLLGQARIEQGSHSLTAPMIRYDLKTQHLVSKSNATDQTIITIHPEQK